MPNQSTAPGLAEYALYDTAPELRVQLCDGDGEPINLTGATVVINIAYTRGSYGYQPSKRLVDGGACVPDPDQVANIGYVNWAPLNTDLSVWGTFRYNFEITYAGGKRQTISPIGSSILTVQPPVGGVQYGSPTP